MNTWELKAKPGFDTLTQTERPSPSVGAREVKVRMRAVAALERTEIRRVIDRTHR